MSEQPEVALLDADSAFEAEMLVLRFQQVTGRMPSAQELKDAQERLAQIKRTDD